MVTGREPWLPGEVVYSFDFLQTGPVLERWFEGYASDEVDRGWTRAELEEHVRDEHSTFTWLLEPMIQRAGFTIEAADYSNDQVFAQHLCRRHRPGRLNSRVGAADTCWVPTAQPALSITTRRVAGYVAAGLAAVVAIPIVQGALLSLTDRPEVPGPHHQDGLIPSTAGADEPLHLVWLGDSLASGVGADTPDGAFPRKAASLFCANDDRSVALTCLAREGARANDVLTDQVPAATALIGRAAVAVITVGSNDVGSLTRPRHFRHDYDAILASLTATGATVIAVGLPDIGSAKVIRQPLRSLARWAGRRADSQIRSIARRHGAHFVDIDLRAGRTNPAVYLAADRYHPNNETYAMWAGRVAALLTLVTATPTPANGVRPAMS